jgi:hypothetical protein
MRIEPRRVNEEERAMLELILGGATEEAERLRAQVPELVVVGRCGCGCPTIEFETSIVSTGSVSQLAGFEGTVPASGTEPPVDILVFVNDGVLSSLELVSYGDHVNSSWPPVESVQVRSR